MIELDVGDAVMGVMVVAPAVGTNSINARTVKKLISLMIVPVVFKVGDI